VDRVRELLDGGDVGVNDSDAEGFTALYCAAGAGHMALVHILLEGGATVDQAKANGATPLFVASQLGKLEVVKVLIKSGAKVNQAMKTGATPLYMASQNGKLEVVKALIKAKAKVNQATEEGATPLYIASEHGKLEVVKVLIEAKAKVNQAEEDGTTPLFIASKNAHVEVVTTLIEAGAAVDQARKDGATPIYVASQKGHAPIVQVLIDAGARTAELMFKGIYSPLHTATFNGHLECVKLLTGFRPNTPGWTTFLAGATSKKELEASLARRSRRRPTGSRPKNELPKIFDRAYLEPIWKFQQERYSDLHLTGGPRGETALEMAEVCKKIDVVKLLRGMMVLKEGKAVGEKEKKATKGGKN
jgi:serine/threonine-protein phosphatase 6 regulatory ankyrin repeat subunit B